MKVRRDNDQGLEAVLNCPALDCRRIFDRVVRTRIQTNAAFKQLTMSRVQPSNLIAVVDPGDQEAITVTSVKKIDCGNDTFGISAERYVPSTADRSAAVERNPGHSMVKAKVFRSGNSQAVRLPKEFRVSSDEVEIFRRGDEIVLRERPLTLANAFELLCDLPEDMLEAQTNDPPQLREGL
jgi:antitoxin VapB